MRTIAFVAALTTVVFWAVGNPAAEVVEIALPELLGVYPVSLSETERTAPFTLPRLPQSINSVHIRVSGETEVGQLICDGAGPYPWPMDVGARMVDLELTHQWLAWHAMPESAGAFGWTAQFRASPPSGSDWSFLLDGEAAVALYGAPAILVGLCSPVGPAPTALVTEAVLIVDVEYAVPAHETSWGNIKALYAVE